MVPKWALTLPWNIIDKTSKRHGLDPTLIGAFCYVESGGKPSASRYEPNWRYFVTPDVFAKRLGITVETESVHQATSFGIMQVMGTVARELGFQDNLPKMIIPHVGIEYGILKLKLLIAKYQALPEAIAAYNAGTPRRDGTGKFENQDYVDKVTKCHVDLS